MRRFLLPFLCIFGLAAVLVAAVRTDSPGAADPLRLLPEDCLLVVKIEQPQTLIDLLLNYAKMPELQRISAFRDFIESTNFQRFQQFLAHVEKEYGHAWPALLDKLAGHGAALGLVVSKKEGEEPALVLVLQGKDSALTQKAYETLITMTEYEQARTESKEKVQRGEHRGVKGAKLGKNALLAPMGEALVFSTSEAAIKAVVDRYLDKGKGITGQPHLVAARKELPPHALAWGWLNLERAKEAMPKEAREQLLELPSPMPILHYLAGGWLEAARRSPYVTLDLCDGDDGPMLNLRMPRGREGMHVAATAHVHPQNEPGARPLLEPKGTLYTTSFFWDPYVFWDKRKEMAVEGFVKEMEEGDKKSAAILLGRRASQLLALTGTHYRFLIVRQFQSEYQTKPKDAQPGYALVTDSRDPDAFAKAIEPLIRAAGLFGTFNAKMILFEEQRGPWKLLGYRFAENARNKSINHGTLFNFSPCYVRVGNQFIFSSTRELALTLIPLVEKEATLGAYRESASSRHRYSWSGLAVYLESLRDQLITSTILQEGVEPDKAAQQVNDLFKLLDRLGHVDAAVYYEPQSFRVEVRTNYKAAYRK
jgi:hypothetical protein